LFSQASINKELKIAKSCICEDYGDEAIFLTVRLLQGFALRNDFFGRHYCDFAQDDNYTHFDA